MHLHNEEYKMIANLKDSQGVTIFGQKCPIEGSTFQTWHQSDNDGDDETWNCDECQEDMLIQRRKDYEFALFLAYYQT